MLAALLLGCNPTPAIQAAQLATDEAAVAAQAAWIVQPGSGGPSDLLGTTGEYVPSGGGGGGGGLTGPWELAAVGAAPWQLSADSLSNVATQLRGGSGAVETTITVESTDGVPLPGVAVWITSGGASGSINIVAGPLMSNSSGQVTFMLPAGTWYVWREMSGENFPNPQAITVG